MALVNYWRRRRLYDRACEAYKDGLREGLASRDGRRLFDTGLWREPWQLALDAGRRAGAAWDPTEHPYAPGPDTGLPTEAWALVLAEAQRP